MYSRSGSYDCQNGLKTSGVAVAGLPFLEILFHKVDPRIEVKLVVSEGSYHKAGAILAEISGPARGILSAKQTALNLVQHASGVATVTSTYVKKVAGFGCAIMDTRRTLPGLRSLEKYAVRVGGGMNHRFGLDDRFIIKTNHLAFLSDDYESPIMEAAKQVSAMNPNLLIEIEVNNLKSLPDALQTNANAIILCHLMPDEVAKCVSKIRESNKKIYVDSPRTITLDTIRAYAELKVDAIFIRDLTNSAQTLDIGMECRLDSHKI